VRAVQPSFPPQHGTVALTRLLVPPFPSPLSAGLDTVVSRVAPSRAFDQLDPDFNYALFLSILIVGMSAVVYMGRAARLKDTKDGWK
jgi:hypothetical protein